jgi:hypothetical protein
MVSVKLKQKHETCLFLMQSESKDKKQDIGSLCAVTLST